MTKKKMLRRMILGALLKRKSRVVLSLFAIGIGTAVVFALLSVYLDINIKMSKELRSYGANMVIAPADKQEKFITGDQYEEVLKVIDNNLVGAAPYLYGVVVIDKHRLVMVGTDFTEAKKVCPYWNITGEWIDSKNLDGAILGITAAEKLGLKIGDRFFALAEATGQKEEFIVKAILKTGSTEDNQVFVNLSSLQNLLQIYNKMNIAYLSVIGKADILSEKAREITQLFPSLSAEPIKRIAKSEGIILEKVKSLVYLVVIIILLSTLLCVATTMMSMVLERKTEIGLKKALGAANMDIVGEFLGEAIFLGAGGAIIGSLFGYGFAQVIGFNVFKSYIAFRPLVLMVVLLISVIVTCTAAIWPIRVVVAVDPAVVLKGE